MASSLTDFYLSADFVQMHPDLGKLGNRDKVRISMKASLFFRPMH